MEEQFVSALVNALVALIAAHPKAFAVIAALWGVALLWKAQPKEKRDEWTKRSPRGIGVIRAVLELAPDLVGFTRVVVYQVIKGLASRQASPPTGNDRPSSPGFAEQTVLTVIGGVSLVALLGFALTGCPMPAPDGCTPFATRCSPSGIPETCSQSQRWSHAPPATPCSIRGPVVCCWTRSPYGRELHACVPESACLPETGDAGVEVSDAR